MKTAVSIITFVLPGLVLAQQMNWGSGMAMGMQGCGYQQAMGRQAQSESDEVSELKNQIKELEKDKEARRKELALAKKELQKADGDLKLNFDSDVYQFLKTHFDSRNRCRDYDGFREHDKHVSNSEAAPASNSAKIGVETSERLSERQPNDISGPRRGGPPPGGRDGIKPDRTGFAAKKDSDDSNSSSTIEPSALAKIWTNVCDLENNARGRVSASICEYRQLLDKSDIQSCKQAVASYPRARSDVDRLQKEIETITQTIKDTRVSLAEARKQKPEMDAMEKTEGGICLECLAGGSGGGQRANSNANLGGTLANAAMALMAYSSTKSFYGEMADKNANLGFPTPMPTSSPFMAASPYILGAISTGLGQGGFGCSGQSGMSAMMNGNGMMSPQMMMSGGMNSMMGLGQQNSGVFGMPQWAQSSPLAAMNFMGGLQGTSMYGTNGIYSPLLLQNGMMSGSLGGMSGIYGVNGLTGLSGLSGLSGLTGINGLSGLNGLSSLTGGTNIQYLQYQIQAQQQYAQQQMQYYQSAIQQTQAVSGLQTEMAGLLQRIQAVQSGSYYGNSLNGVSGGYGGLPSLSTINTGSTYYGR